MTLRTPPLYTGIFEVLNELFRRRPSPRVPRLWPRSQEDLHQGIQGLGQGGLRQGIQGLGEGIKKTFIKGSKALAKEPGRPSPRDPRP